MRVPPTIGERIHVARIAAGYSTKRGFADATGTTESTVWRWEKNKVKPNADALNTISRLCAVSMRWLVDGYDDDDPRHPALREFLASKHGRDLRRRRPPS